MLELGQVAEALVQEFPSVREKLASLDGLEPLLARVKLRLMSAQEVLDLRAELLAETNFYGHMLFLIADPGGNHLGVWLRGSQEGRLVWHWHDEWDLSPVYRDFAHYKSALEAHPEATFFDEVPRDYPDVKGAGTDEEVASDRRVIEACRRNLLENHGEDLRRFFAMSMMQVSPRSDLDEVVVPFLDDRDMYVQERAAVILGEHRYGPARAKLEEVARDGTPNGRLAAKGALDKLASA